jgi:hypothetical protein
MFKLNRQEFWKKLRKIQRVNSEVNVKIEDLEIEYKKLFNEKNETLSRYDTSELEQFIRENKNVNYQHEIDTNALHNIIKNLPNGKSAGFNDINYEMIKYSVFESSNSFIKKIHQVCV